MRYIKDSRKTFMAIETSEDESREAEKKAQEITVSKASCWLWDCVDFDLILKSLF